MRIIVVCSILSLCSINILSQEPIYYRVRIAPVTIEEFPEGKIIKTVPVEGILKILSYETVKGYYKVEYEKVRGYVKEIRLYGIDNSIKKKAIKNYNDSINILEIQSRQPFDYKIIINPVGIRTEPYGKVLITVPINAVIKVLSYNPALQCYKAKYKDIIGCIDSKWLYGIDEKMRMSYEKHYNDSISTAKQKIIESQPRAELQKKINETLRNATYEITENKLNYISDRVSYTQCKDYKRLTAYLSVLGDTFTFTGIKPIVLKVNLLDRNGYSKSTYYNVSAIQGYLNKEGEANNSKKDVYTFKIFFKQNISYYSNLPPSEVPSIDNIIVTSPTGEETKIGTSLICYLCIVDILIS